MHDLLVGPEEFLHLDFAMTMVFLLLLDPKTEKRYTNEYGVFYVPSDERFDYVKMSDNKADLAKAGGHIAQTKIEAKFFNKTNFESIADVKKLFAPKGEITGLNNVLPDKVDVAVKDQHPLRFLNELTAKRADGQKAKAFRFPIPQILKSMTCSICLQALDI